MNKYPIYIISKGRWDSRLTAKALDRMSVPYRIVIEPQEYDNYAAVIDKQKVLVLPFSDLGQGSIPARNWVWEHSLSEGHDRHWILDDNIHRFMRFNKGMRINCGNHKPFSIIEEFTDRYKNVALSGMHYKMFGITSLTSAIKKPFLVNTRVYSCILIKNSLKHRWRGRYNEDTDLSLRCLKDGWCTILFYAFLADKQATMTMKGGNTDELYQDDGRYQMALSLKLQHPHLVEIVRKWGRWQHQVNYKPFKKNKLIFRDDYEPKGGMDNFGMKLKKVNH